MKVLEAVTVMRHCAEEQARGGYVEALIMSDRDNLSDAKSLRLRPLSHPWTKTASSSLPTCPSKYPFNARQYGNPLSPNASRRSRLVAFASVRLNTSGRMETKEGWEGFEGPACGGGTCPVPFGRDMVVVTYLAR